MTETPPKLICDECKSECWIRHRFRTGLICCKCSTTHTSHLCCKSDLAQDTWVAVLTTEQAKVIRREKHLELASSLVDMAIRLREATGIKVTITRGPSSGALELPGSMLDAFISRFQDHLLATAGELQRKGES